MEYGRLSGKLYSHEAWLEATYAARELLITAWSWAIDHDKENGEISAHMLEALSMSLGHNALDDNDPYAVVRELANHGWLAGVEETKMEKDRDGYAVYRFDRWWPEQADLIRKARERREKERERYLRRKNAGGDG